jgi:hypothetical protein
MRDNEEAAWRNGEFVLKRAKVSSRPSRQVSSIWPKAESVSDGNSPGVSFGLAETRVA